MGMVGRTPPPEHPAGVVSAVRDFAFRQVTSGKKACLPLLLLGDEQESMIDRYLARGEMFTLTRGEELLGVAVVTDEGGGVLELQNIAVPQEHWRKGYGTMLLRRVLWHYAGRAERMVLGTGDVPKAMGFYRKCGFERSHVVKDYFLQYDHLMYEDGVLLRDKVYMTKELGGMYDIIIVAGQSNAEGCGLGPVDLPCAPDERVLAMSKEVDAAGGYLVAVAEERAAEGISWADFGLPFAREYVAAGLLAPGRKLLLVRAAVGGTGFADKHWGPEDDHYQNMLRMIEAALAMGGALKALLWHQGETDACFKESEASYAANLRTLLRGVRERFGAPALPFVAGDFVQQWERDNAAVCAPVVAALRSLCAAEAPAAFVETTGLASNEEAIGNGDTIHFSRAAQYALGKRYFEAWRGIAGASPQ